MRSNPGAFLMFMSSIIICFISLVLNLVYSEVIPFEMGHLGNPLSHFPLGWRALKERV
jgi:hypothetical protein